MDRGRRHGRGLGGDDHTFYLEEGPLENYLALPLDHQALALLGDRDPETFYEYLAQNPICRIYSLYRQKDCPKESGHGVSVSRAVVGLFVLFAGILEEGDELSFQFGAAEDLGVRTEGCGFATVQNTEGVLPSIIAPPSSSRSMVALSSGIMALP